MIGTVNVETWPDFMHPDAIVAPRRAQLNLRVMLLPFRELPEKSSAGRQPHRLGGA
jgi:hypothetical protein